MPSRVDNPDHALGAFNHRQRARRQAAKKDSVFISQLPPLPITAGLAVNQVVVGSSGQVLRLFLTNTGSVPLTCLGSSAPRFTLQFVPYQPSGPDDVGPAGALATVSAVRTFQISQPQVYEEVWGCTPNQDAAIPSWILAPVKVQTGTTSAYPLLGTGSQATAVFDIGGVTADTAGLTVAKLNYSGAVGYASGSVTLPIVKVPSGLMPDPVIDSFVVSPASIDLAAGDAPSVTLTFSVANAVSVAIPAANYVAAAAAGPQQLVVPVNRTTSFTLVAANASGQMASLSATVTVTPSPLEILPRGTVLMWSGDVTSLPDGWLLCNGQDMSDGTKTPDLTDQFVVGAGNLYTPGQMADAASHVHPFTPGSYTITTSGNHCHNFTVYDPPTASPNRASCSPSGEHSHPYSFRPFATGSAQGQPAEGQIPAMTALTFLLKQQ